MRDTLDVPALTAEALEEWGSHVEHVLHGIAHALNNRAATLSAVIELASEPSEDNATSSILGTELERLRDLSLVVRAVGAPRAGTEAFGPADAGADALAVLRLHSEQSDRVILIDSKAASPIRVPRWMYVRALVALGAGAFDNGHATETLTIAIAQDGEWLVSRATGRGVSSQTTPLVSELARAMGGEPLQGQPGFRVPTLAALRRREGR